MSSVFRSSQAAPFSAHKNLFTGRRGIVSLLVKTYRMGMN